MSMLNFVATCTYVAWRSTGFLAIFWVCTASCSLLLNTSSLLHRTCGKFIFTVRALCVSSRSFTISSGLADVKCIWTWVLNSSFIQHSCTGCSSVRKYCYYRASCSSSCRVKSRQRLVGLIRPSGQALPSHTFFTFKAWEQVMIRLLWMF